MVHLNGFEVSIHYCTSTYSTVMQKIRIELGEHSKEYLVTPLSHLFEMRKNKIPTRILALSCAKMSAWETDIVIPSSQNFHYYYYYYYINGKRIRKEA
jgi:hypothetical protein